MDVYIYKAYLIARISRKTGKVEDYNIYSEQYPTHFNTVMQLIIDEASGHSFEEARTVLLSKINNKLNPPLHNITDYKFVSKILDNK